MTASEPTGTRSAAGGRVLPLPLLYCLAALAVMVLSGLGWFRSKALFPWVFGGVMALLGLVELWRGRRGADRRVQGLTVAGLVLALLAPAAQAVYLTVDQRRTERTAMAELAGRTAAELVWDYLYFDGGEETAEPRRGRLTVVNFWATWCPPCVKELPMLEVWAATHDPAEVRVVGVTSLYGDVEDPAAVVRELAEIEGFLDRAGVGYLNLVSRTKDNQQAYAVTGMPSTVLVGEGGEALAYGVGIAGTRRVLAEAERRLGELARSPARAGSGG